MSDGLDGVVACQTVLSHTDGETGTIWVRGHTDRRAGRRSTAMKARWRVMWDGFAGDSLTRADMRDAACCRARRSRFRGSTNGSPAAAPRPPIDGLRMCACRVAAG